MKTITAMCRSAFFPLFIILFPPASQATVFSYAFTGSVNTVDAPISVGSGGVFAVGQAVSGTLSYDDTGVDVDPGNPLHGFYLNVSSGTIKFADAGSGAYVASWTSGLVTISNFHCCGADSYNVGFNVAHGSPVVVAPAVNGFFANAATFAPGDINGTAITSDILSGFALPPLSEFERTSFACCYLAYNNGAHSVYYSITSLTPAPAPATLALLGLGLAGLGATRRRKAA